MTLRILIFLFILFGSSEVYAGLVIKVKKKSKTVMVNEVYEVGEKVCFLKETEEIPEDSASLKVCGQVVRVTDNASIVKVEDKIIKKIKKDMTAFLVEQKAKALKLADGNSKDKGLYSYFKGFYVYSAMTPIGYSGLLYDSSDAANQKYWKEEKNCRNSLIGFGAGSDVPLNDRWTISPGIRYRVMEEFVGEAAISDSISNIVIETRTKMSALGLWLDVGLWQYPQIPPDTGAGYRFGTGLDIDYSTMKFTATKMDKKNKIASSKFATAYGTSIIPSLRITNEIFYSFRGTFGLFISINALVPITEIGRKFNLNFDDVDETTIENRKKDLEDALGYKKNPFALEILLGVR